MIQRQELNPQALGNLKLMEAFEALDDPRRCASCSYPLAELLLTALCAIASDADDWVGVALWRHEKLDWLRRFLAVDKGIASHDTFSRAWREKKGWMR